MTLHQSQLCLLSILQDSSGQKGIIQKRTRLTSIFLYFQFSSLCYRRQCRSKGAGEPLTYTVKFKVKILNQREVYSLFEHLNHNYMNNFPLSSVS